MINFYKNTLLHFDASSIDSVLRRRLLRCCAFQYVHMESLSNYSCVISSGSHGFQGKYSAPILLDSYPLHGFGAVLNAT